MSRALLFLQVAGLWAAAAMVCATGVADDNSGFAQQLKPFLQTHCVRCHSGDEAKADRKFDVLTGEISDSNALADYQDILDQLNLSQMPPEDEPQPSDKDRRAVVGWLTQRIADWHQQQTHHAAQAVLRRMNAREYRNTIRDLMVLDVSMFHPDATFPRDQITDNLDNVGDSLVMSGYLLARYLDAADQVVRKALGSTQRPDVRTWTFRDNFRQQPEIDQVHGKTNGFSHITLYDVKAADKPEGAYGPLHNFRHGVPLDGTYEIRVKAQAVNREHPYDPEFLGTDPSEPLRLGIVAGNERVGPLHKPQPIEPQLAEIELSDEPQWYTVRVWLDQGYTPRFTFNNGLMDVRDLWGRLLKKYEDQFPERTRPGIVEARFNAIKYGKLPQIHITEVEITGPLFDEWPTPSQRLLLGNDWDAAVAGTLTIEQLQPHLARFAGRAFRRPVKEAELAPVMQVVRERRNDGQSVIEAFGDGLRTILCSPSFVYLPQGDGGALSDWALASRLSYFLWSSMPDDELFALAEAGSLHDHATLKSQVDRMLQDRRSDAFVAGFLDSWLNLRDLGSMPPDRSRFREFYHYDLDTAMREETRQFFRHLLTENLSITNFLDSDFAIVNRPLARHYGLPEPQGSGFEKVAVNDRRRGGLLGQASVLTVTANGIDTSPVVRGVWVLENLLGDPPTPPPPDVEPLDPDVRGTTTIREQLEKHRRVASCRDCHRSIDPMGFALENFDPVGGWRDTYGGRVKIDASGELPGGRTYRDIEEFKVFLLERREQFSRALTSRLLAYATGRHIVPADRPHVDRIVENVASSGYGVRDLVLNVVLSEPFQSP